MFLPRALLCLLAAATILRAAEDPWQKANLFEAPKASPTTDCAQPGVEALYFEGRPWQGKPTKVFAYVGIPKHAPGEKVPGMVLIHGGGGTAFATWVKRWNERGYAAIAMDTCGALPLPQPAKGEKRPRHDAGGPPGWGGWEQTALPLEDQWTHHAVADVVLAHSLLRARPEVDPERIGLTGISWGGYLTCIVAGVDPRFKFAVPVYGCGYLGDNSAWLGEFQKLGPEATKTWLQRWDPSVYLPRAKMPMLWVTGTNDFAYPMDSLQKSYWLPQGPVSLCVRVRMPHGHGAAGEAPEEIRAFADHFLKGGPALTQVSVPVLKDGVLRATWSGERPPVKAELSFTRETGFWPKRLWETQPAELSAAEKSVQARLPEKARVAYLNLIDAAGLVVSTQHVELSE